MKSKTPGINEREDLGLAGLKRHTHEERQEILDELVPVIENLLGDNLIAIASQASFARGDDTDFSDLELVAFVREEPKELKEAFSRIIDGMLVECIITTGEKYLEEVLDITGMWYIAGSDTLAPVTNPDFIERLKDFNIENANRKFRNISRAKMHNLQECFGKLFTAIEQENRESLFMIFFDAVNALFQVMSYINRKPYTTLARFTQEARSFSIKPDGFDEFLQIAIDGKYQDLERLKKVSVRVFRGLEEYFMEKYGEIYNSDLATIGKEIF